MTSSNAPAKGYSRRFALLATAIVIAILAYTAGWFWLADRLEAETARTIAALEARGQTLECNNAVARGYPFRMGLFCDSLAFADPSTGVSASAGAFRSAAQIYEPTRLVGEIDGPAALTVPGLGTLDLSWTSFQASTKLAGPLPSRASGDASGLVVAQAGQTFVAASRATSHMRTRDGDVDVAMSLGDLVLDPALVGGAALPPLQMEFQAVLEDGVARATAGMDDLRGARGRIDVLRVQVPENGALSLSGPFEVDASGQLDARLTVTAANPRVLARLAGELLPDRRDDIERMSAGLLLLGNTPSLPLTIEKGRATLGFIPLGQIPPL